MAIDIQLDSLPAGPLKIAALEGCREFAKVVDKDLSEMRRKSPLARINFPLKGYWMFSITALPIRCAVRSITCLRIIIMKILRG